MTEYLHDDQLPDRFAPPTGNLFVFVNEVQVKEFIYQLAFDCLEDIDALGVKLNEYSSSLVDDGDEFEVEYEFGDLS